MFVSFDIDNWQKANLQKKQGNMQIYFTKNKGNRLYDTFKEQLI